MPPNSRKSLQTHGIYLIEDATREGLVDCPEPLQGQFHLLLHVEKLEWGRFGGRRKQDSWIECAHVMEYESELKAEAMGLAETCRDDKRSDDNEETWVQVQQPVVFYRFNREDEEIYARKRHHHCFICGKHFPLRSRPLVNKYRLRDFGKRVKGVHGDNDHLEDVNVCKLHKNIPHFESSKLPYLGFDGEDKKIPDLTIGLLSWSEGLPWSAPPGMEDEALKQIMAHDTVKPFRHEVLHQLEDKGYLKPLFSYPASKKGTYAAREKNPTLVFPFAIYEAKRAKQGNPVAQNALKVKMILEWQRELAEQAQLPWEPLVFHFVSSGSEWKLYACYIQKAKTYHFRLMWSGQCTNDTKALQLLYLVDLIALWGQFQYKPFAAACVRILERKSRQEDISHFLRNNPFGCPKSIIAENFQTIRLQKIFPRRTHISRCVGAKMAKRDRDEAVIQGMRNLSIEDYVIPEKDEYIWLLHRQTLADLLVVRVNTEGGILPPLVVFKDSNWESKEFEWIVKEERVRMPKDIGVDFRIDQKKNSIWKRHLSRFGVLTQPEIQFCAILPLTSKWIKSDESDTKNHFQPLERLLGLRKLVSAAKRANKLWCKCQKEEKEDDMILCTSTRCTVGWWHKKCAGNANASREQHWICKQCEASSDRITLAKYDNFGFHKDVLEKSDKRIQRVRSLHRVWNEHQWPAAEQVRRVINGKVLTSIQMETNKAEYKSTMECLKDGEKTGSGTPQCWAVIRNDPYRVTHVKQRFCAA